MPSLLQTRKNGNRVSKKPLLFLLPVVLLTFIIILLVFFGQAKYLYGEDFGIHRVRSSNDFDGDGIDDSTDILYGARRDAENHPEYKSTYCVGGYPPDNIGVCTDTVWRAFAEAGYSLRLMLNADAVEHTELYPNITKPDSNIDFRRVKNLRVFFDRYGIILTNDINDIAEWQPGDIVIFGDNQHIGIVSDRRDATGKPYIIHNGGENDEREEPFLGKMKVAAHYRFDEGRLPEELRIEFEGKGN